MGRGWGRGTGRSHSLCGAAVCFLGQESQLLAPCPGDRRSKRAGLTAGTPLPEGQKLSTCRLLSPTNRDSDPQLRPPQIPRMPGAPHSAKGSPAKTWHTVPREGMPAFLEDSNRLGCSVHRPCVKILPVCGGWPHVALVAFHHPVSLPLSFRKVPAGGALLTASVDSGGAEHPVPLFWAWPSGAWQPPGFREKTPHLSAPSNTMEAIGLSPQGTV